tara:strand:+ start:3947 stop:4177 length:231 start_codon:yes stop_codon:yes gene_type:complete
MTYITHFIDKIEYNKTLDTCTITTPENKAIFLDSESIQELNEKYRNVNVINKPIALTFINAVKYNKLKYWNYYTEK